MNVTALGALGKFKNAKQNVGKKGGPRKSVSQGPKVELFNPGFFTLTVTRPT